MIYSVLFSSLSPLSLFTNNSPSTPPYPSIFHSLLQPPFHHLHPKTLRERHHEAHISHPYYPVLSHLPISLGLGLEENVDAQFPASFKTSFKEQINVSSNLIYIYIWKKTTMGREINKSLNKTIVSVSISRWMFGGMRYPCVALRVCEIQERSRRSRVGC